MERAVGGGIGMGNTCKPMAVSFQCMTKSTTIKKKSNHSRKNVFDLIKKRFKIVSTTAFRHQFTEHLLHTWHFSKGKKRKNRKICHSVEFLTA